MEATITVGEVELLIEGTLNKGEKGNHLQPPESASFEVDKVTWEDKDVTDLLINLKIDIQNFGEKVLEKLT